MRQSWMVDGGWWMGEWRMDRTSPCPSVNHQSNTRKSIGGKNGNFAGCGFASEDLPSPSCHAPRFSLLVYCCIFWIALTVLIRKIDTCVSLLPCNACGPSNIPSVVFSTYSRSIGSIRSMRSMLHEEIFILF